MHTKSRTKPVLLVSQKVAMISHSKEYHKVDLEAEQDKVTFAHLGSLQITSPTRSLAQKMLHFKPDDCRVLSQFHSDVET